MYYDIVNSGERIKELRAARRMTRQQLAEQIGLSVDALRKIEAGVNGAKIDTLISIAERICYPIWGWLRNREDSILSSHTN